MTVVSAFIVVACGLAIARVIWTARYGELPPLPLPFNAVFIGCYVAAGTIALVVL